MFVFDLDHTVIDSSHRQSFDANGKLDLAHWKANCTADNIAKDTLLPLANYMKAMYETGETITICTARVLSVHDLQYLQQNGLKYHHLLSRPEDNCMPDDVLKYTLLKSKFGIDFPMLISAFFDDNKNVIKSMQECNVRMVDAIFANNQMRKLHGA